MPGNVIGLDLDGVVADYTDALRQHVARTRNQDPNTLHDPASWAFTDANWGFNNIDDYTAAHAQAVNDGMFATMPAIAGAIETLTQLSDEGAHIRIITHRLIIPRLHRRAVIDTVEWLDTVGVPYRDVCFIGDKATVDADVYVEDAPHNIAALRNAGRTVIIYNASYNQHLPGLRAHTWPQTGQLIRDVLGMPTTEP